MAIDTADLKATLDALSREADGYGHTLAEGGGVDLSGLEQHTREFCNAMAAAGATDETRALLPALNSLVATIDGLIETLKQRQGAG